MKAELRKNRHAKPSKKIVGAEQMWNPIEVEQVNGCRVTEKYSWCQVTLSSEWQSNIVLSCYNMIYLEISKF